MSRTSLGIPRKDGSALSAAVLMGWLDFELVALGLVMLSDMLCWADYC